MFIAFVGMNIENDAPVACFVIFCLSCGLFPQSLCDKLIQQINDIGKMEGRERDRKLRDLLHKSFPVIRFKTLRPIVMAILKHTREVDHKFLKVLVSIRCLL